jgi:hypothetical protein
LKGWKRRGVMLAALATASAVIVLAGVPASASPSSAKQAVSSSGDPSGIGMPQGGPDVLMNSTYYDRALNSSDWGNTPDGLVYKSCVYQIPSGAEIDSTHNEIIEASGATLPAPPCPYSRLVRPATVTATTQSGVAAPAAVNPADTEWLGYATYSTSSPLNHMTTGYAVPYPPTQPGATDYIFSSFQDSAVTSILQPVVGFGPTAGNQGTLIGGNYQWIAPYYVWGGNVAVGVLNQVHTNDTIHGELGPALGCGPGGGDCGWNIIVSDVTSGHLASSTLYVNSSPAYTRFDGAVVETTGGGCNKLFSNGHAVFRGVSATTTAGAVSPSWFFFTAGQCSMYITGSGANLDILWTP